MISAAALEQPIHYVVVLEQFLLGATVSSDPHRTLDSAYSWLKAHGVFDPKSALIGHLYSDGEAVIGRWEIRRVVGA
jgi:hypothetical protein